MTAPHLDGSDGEGDLPPSIDVRVENTKNVLELLGDDQRLKTQDTKVSFIHVFSNRNQLQTLKSREKAWKLVSWSDTYLFINTITALI